MSTFGEMQDRIADELMRSDLTTQIQRSIKSAVEHHTRSRYWFLEARETGATVAGTPYVACPTDTVEIDTVSITRSGTRHKLEEIDWSEMDELQGVGDTSSLPCKWAYYDDLIWLYPTPDQAYTITISHHNRLTSLSATNDTNAWMTFGEELIRCRAKRDLYLHVLRDREGAELMLLAEREAEQNLTSENTKRISTGRLKPTCF